MTEWKHTGTLLWSNLRQNKTRHLVWLVILIGLFASAAQKFNVLFGTRTDINAIVATLKTPAMVSLFGEFSATKPYTTANVFASEMVLFMGMFIAFMNISFVVKNTRGQEDSGMLEMIRARAVGRLAPIAATFLEVLLVNSVMGLVLTASLISAGLNGATITGDGLMGMVLASGGILFGCISLLSAQLVSNARSAGFLSYGIYGVFYLMRMLTDVSAPKYTWASPVGWGQKSQIYTKDAFLPVLLTLLLALICLLVAVHLVRVRDIGSGLIAARSGKGQASRFLSSPLGLILTTERNSILLWGLGSIVLGAAYGSIFGTIGDIIKTNPTYKQILGVTQIASANRELLLDFVHLLSTFFVVLAAVSGLMIIYRLKSDEKKGYLEIIHAKRPSKTTLFLSYMSVGTLVSLLIFLLTLAAVFIVGNTFSDETLGLEVFWHCIAGFVPALLFFVGLGGSLIGALPKLSSALWLYLTASVLIKFFGPLLDLPKSTENISPLGWIGKVPVDAVDPLIAWLLLGAFILLTMLGIFVYNKRDLE